MNSKTITELRSSIFESFDMVASGETLQITHKNGTKIAMVSLETIENLKEEASLHKNLAIGYAQALRGEGITTVVLKDRLKEKERILREKYS